MPKALLATAALMLALYVLMVVLCYRADRAGGVSRRLAFGCALRWPVEFVRFVMGSGS